METFKNIYMIAVLIMSVIIFFKIAKKMYFTRFGLAVAGFVSAVIGVATYYLPH